MNTPAFLKNMVTIALLASSMAAWAAWAASFDANIADAKSRLQAEQYDRARTAALNAVGQKPNDYRGHYYLAMAELALGKNAEAQAAGNKALDLAPASGKAAINKLLEMAKGPPPVSAGAVGQADANELVIACSYTTVFSPGWQKSDEELWKISGNKFSLWSKTIEDWLVYCSNSTCSATPGNFSVSRTTRDGPLVELSLNISRQSGRYSKSQTFYKSLNKDEGVDFTLESTGMCRPANDPFTAKPKF